MKTWRILAIIKLMLFSNIKTHANVLEYYGASYCQIGLAGSLCPSIEAGAQAKAPALLALSSRTQFSLTHLSINHQFKAINNVVVNSPVNSQSTDDVYGDVDVKYPNQNLVALNLYTLIFPPLNIGLGISIASPMKSLARASTGDSFRPEYVMYRARNERSVMNVNLTFKVSPKLGLALGKQIGIRAESEAFMIARDTGADSHSSGKMQFEAKPATSNLLAFAYDLEHERYITLSYAEHLSSSLSADVSGLTPIGASSLKFKWDLQSLLYFDPSITRLAYIQENENFGLTFGVDYQDWSGYRSPKLRIKNDGGILKSGKDYESLKVRSIFIPKIGMTKKFSSSHQFGLGLSYHPTPINRDLNESGNSLDLNKTVLASFYEYKIPLKTSPLGVGFAMQWHRLEENNIKKTSKREDGSTGTKIGGKEYTAGGNVFVVTLGLSYVL